MRLLVSAGCRALLGPPTTNAGRMAPVHCHRVNACKAAGAKMAVALPVSVPSHCSLMKGAADKLAEALAAIEFSTPAIPVINNVDVAAPTDVAAIRDALVRQLYCPVRWTETVEAMAADGITHLVECGPGKVLTGLAKRINKAVSAQAVNDVASFAALTE